MAFSETFRIGYLKTKAVDKEEIFLSVTPHFYCGPGIQRDGFSSPRMTDPHTVDSICVNAGFTPYQRNQLPPTDNPYIQRAGTWTLFNHVNNFIKKYGRYFEIIGIQSCGDLTMNPWHVALIHIKEKNILCHLDTPGDEGVREPIHERIYRCLVKWKSGLSDSQYNFIDLKFVLNQPDGYFTTIVDEDFLEENKKWIEEKEINPQNITDKIEFALSGKPIIKKGRDIILSNVIDPFQDVRHIFNLPTVPAHGAIGQLKINQINFGEYILYNDLNARRGALNSPILVDLRSRGVEVKYEELEESLKEKHYQVTKPPNYSPTRRGEYRLYSENTVEIFFPFNVYPFGVVGGKEGSLVCLASGGLSGRVGNTLEGITRIVYDFFGCEDALVLDEGYDTFHVVNYNINNPTGKKDNYSNEELLKDIAKFTLWQLEQDVEDCKKKTIDYHLGNDLEKWPLNKSLIHELKEFSKKNNISPIHPSELSIMAVEPHRSQMRAILFFARKKSKR